MREKEGDKGNDKPHKSTREKGRERMKEGERGKERIKEGGGSGDRRR